MNEKDIPYYFIILFIITVIVGFGFTGIESRNTQHIRRADEYGRQMERTGELVGTIDSGLSSLQEGLVRIKGIVSDDARDLRVLAARLREIAAEVTEMENNIIYLRGSISGFLDDNDTGCDKIINAP